MTQSRRVFLKTAAASAGAITILPFIANAAAHGGNSFETPGGPVTIHPVSHASFVMETPKGVIYVDPVGEADLYSDFPTPDLVLVTHQHGDHYNPKVLSDVMGDATPMITNSVVGGLAPGGLTERIQVIGNGDSAEFNGMTIDAIPAYNMTEDRKKFHPEGRDNGYVLNLDGFRVYISGDTEDIPEMRALQNIDLAFVCMNLPFTMDAAAAADAVAEFKPTHVYPYHYRGRDGGTQDPEEFAKMVGDAADVRLGAWYG